LPNDTDNQNAKTRAHGRAQALGRADGNDPGHKTEEKGGKFHGPAS
jgi:hypothetical protein